MWIGVDRGLAGMKFSGSPRMLGANREINISEKRRSRKPTESFEE